jgi:hypothetical protein
MIDITPDGVRAATTFVLRLSTADWRVHAFAPLQSSPAWTALCGAGLQSSALEEVHDETPSCVPCVRPFGEQVADLLEARYG